MRLPQELLWVVDVIALNEHTITVFVRRTRHQLGAPLCAAQIPDSSDTRAGPSAMVGHGNRIQSELTATDSAQGIVADGSDTKSENIVKRCIDA